MLSLFVYYLFSLITGALFITGFFAATRGSYKIQPDGSEVWTGMILSGWLRFWEQSSPARIFYEGDQLKTFMASFENFFGMSSWRDGVSGRHYTFSQEEKSITVDTATAEYLKNRFFLYRAQHPDIGMSMNAHAIGFSSEAYIFFYKDIKEYRFPLLRKPMASCIYCLSSIYGSLSWIFIYIVARHLAIDHVPFSVVLLLWIPYIISLSFLNPLLWRKVN